MGSKSHFDGSVNFFVRLKQDGKLYQVDERRNPILMGVSISSMKFLTYPGRELVESKSHFDGSVNFFMEIKSSGWKRERFTGVEIPF